MKNIKVGLLFGGRSAEHEVSLVSAASIFKCINKEKYEIFSVYISKKGGWRIVDSPLLSASELNSGSFFSFIPWTKQSNPIALDVDIYFPILHGPYGEDGTIQGLFEMADVPYVGATVLASAVGMDKCVAKALFAGRDLPVVRHLVFHEEDWRENRGRILEEITEELPLPLFVKPANLGSSVGITKVKDHAVVEEAIQEAFQYDHKIILEEGIQGRELECSVLGNSDPRASLPGEIIPSREFYDYRDKYQNGKTSFGIPADVPPSTVSDIQRISIEAFRAIDCSGMARIDFFLQESPERLYLSEINTIPGFTEISMYPKLWEVSGLSFSQLLDELIALGFERHQKKKRKGLLFKA